MKEQASALLSPAFESVMGTAHVAVLVKNEAGYYIYANHAAEALLGYDSGQISGKHISEVVQTDQTWVASEFQRFKAQQVWSGRLMMRHLPDGVVDVAVNAFLQAAPGRSAAYTAFIRPVSPEAPTASNVLSVQTPRYGLTPADVRLIQLMAEGFGDRELGVILGVSSWVANREVSLVLQKMYASSRTEACILAIKAGLIL